MKLMDGVHPVKKVKVGQASEVKKDVAKVDVSEGIRMESIQPMVGKTITDGPEESKADRSPRRNRRRRRRVTSSNRSYSDSGSGSSSEDSRRSSNAVGDDSDSSRENDRTHYKDES